MRLIWLPRARSDLRYVLNYVSERNVFAAHRLNDVFERTSEQLTSHPFMGRQGRVSGTREVVAHPNYVLVYRVDDDLVTIVRLLHARQQYP